MLFSCLSSQTTEPREGPEFSYNAGEADTHWSSPSSNLALLQKDTLWDTEFLQTDKEPRTALLGRRGYRHPRTTPMGHRGAFFDYGFPISFAELLEKYSKLHFSFESDIVDAFRAIGNTFAQRKPPVLHLYGLPFISDDESMTASSITRGLAWCLERGNEATARRPGFPSWSWLGYRGPVRWGARLRDVSTLAIDRQWSAKTFSHVSSMITISNRRFELLQLSQWWREWSSGNASEGLAPSRLMIQGAMIKRIIWLGAKCTKKTLWGESTRYIIKGKGGWLSNIEYAVGDGLMMSADACQCLLGNLRRGSWMALLLTDDFLLIIQPVAAGAKVGSYRRVASADINVFHSRKYHRMERDGFVKKYTKLVGIELE
ncbi:HET-domain-containing protein [Apiospora arundinis]|uniref:HET-domain-containing protein n=1 Tax=Apiospora arundinis TaxID=335852 RepID=A0ABR2JBZ7_9PEZI